MQLALRLVTATLLALAFIGAMAGTVEDANGVVDRWSAAYSSNEPDEVVKIYWPDAILLGTVSPVMSEGTAAIQVYFSRLKGSGNKNSIGDRRSLILSESAVAITGFYLFTSLQDGREVPRPSRFTMLVVKRGDEWRILHHHSSPHVQPTK
jgi:uncharacterized protein (TIGR02246 family)